MHSTIELLKNTSFPKVVRGHLTTLQVNLGYQCNQSCLHCHVNAGPKRTETMSHQTVAVVLEYLGKNDIACLDLIGGAPELNNHFRELVETARHLGVHVIDRSNLTILTEKGCEDLAEFLANHQVEVIASLPCHLEENVDSQRGSGVYERSIQGLKQLNHFGYGQSDKHLPLHLVFNPSGPNLPPSQEELESTYKRELGKKGITFNRLLTLANMPIERFGSTLISKGQFEHYMELLRSAHDIANLKRVMCRSLISVDWRGYVYDCDFNQMLGLGLKFEGASPPHLRDIMETDLSGYPVTVADHCYGCTAGQGSSCGGALS